MKRVRHSLFFKLLWVLVAGGVLVNLVAGLAVFHMFQAGMHSILENRLAYYMKYVIKEIGEPPVPDKARRVEQELAILIRYESGQQTWASSDALPPIRELRTHLISERAGFGRYQGRMFTIVDRPSGSYALATDMRRHVRVRLVLLLFPLLTLSLLFLLVYLAIKHMLQPIRRLEQGVERVQAGDLSTPIAVRGRDELARLSESFNTMMERISSMIRAREQLLLDVSHELRSPLTRLKLGLEFIEDGGQRERLRRDVDEMDTMIRELLESERLASRHGGLQREETDLRELLREEVERLRQRKPGLELDAEQGLPGLLLDRDRVRTALRNVLENACRASQQQQEPVRIQVRSKADRVVVQVQDKGKGIGTEHLPLLFEPFYRIDKDRSRRSGGYGLGLFLCKRIMEAHGGRIEVESREGQGTIFRLIFPLSL